MITEMEKWRDEYFKDEGRTYQNHVSKFINYLKHIGKADTPNKITLEDVSNCVGYYANLETIRAVATMESHLESLKSFYDYLLQTGKSRDIFSQMNYDEYKNNIAKQYNLSEKVGRETFGVETIKDILFKLDNYLETDYFILTGVQIQRRYFHRTILRLFVKLTLIAPAKRQVICDLRYSDFGEDFRTVVVNEIELTIPNSLRRDFKEAVKLRMAISMKNVKPEEKVFKYIVGANFNEEDLNRWFCSFIKDQHIIGIEEIDGEKDTYPVEPVMKTAISNLAKGKANLAYISKISGIKIGSLEERYREEIFDITQSHPTIGESIEWEIRKSKYYSYI